MVLSLIHIYFSLPLFVNAMIIATLGAVQLWLINPVTAVVTLIGTLIVVGVIAWYSTFLESKIGEYREKDGEASSRASDIATGLRTIAGLGAEEQMRERYHLSLIHILSNNTLMLPNDKEKSVTISNNSSDAHTTVSYTHLDVYKRQRGARRPAGVRGQLLRRGTDQPHRGCLRGRRELCLLYTSRCV